MSDLGESASLRERVSSVWDALRSSFGFLSAVAMALGLLVGFALPSVDAALEVELPVFGFAEPDVARSLLQTVATATVSVAGLSFSVTVVAFTLASSQLSPRVLRSFRADRLSQATLACLLGTFIYCLAVLIRLGSAQEDGSVPNLSITLAVVLAVVAFGMFAAFIAHIVSMLQPASIIDGIRETGRGALESPYPAGIGEEPEDEVAAARAVARTRGGAAATPVLAEREGYVSSLQAMRLVAAGAACDGLVVQRVQIGEYVTPGLPLADVWCGEQHRREALVDTVRAAFVLGRQRTPVQDAAFPLRQLADVALKGLSPGVNDPTTAQNAIEALTSLLIRSATGRHPSRLRADEHGVVRLVALAPDLDDLVRLGFEQVRVFAAPYPAVSRRLLTLLARVDDAARQANVPCTEPAHQATLIAQGPDDSLPTSADVSSVRAHHAALWPTRR